MINKYQRGLTELGLEKGDRVLMLVSPGTNFLALSYAVIGRGAIPFFLDPGMGKEKLFKCIEDIAPDVFIGTQKAQLLRIFKKKIFSSLKFYITANDWAITGGPTLSFLKKFSFKPLPPVETASPCLVAYTSGATGTPKGVEFTNEMMARQQKIFTEIFDMEAGAKDLPLLPIFSLYNLANGVCSVFPPVNPAKPLSLDPPKIVKIVNDLRISYSFGSPTLWKKISEYCTRSRQTLKTLKKVFMAGAPVSHETIERVESILEDGIAYTPYGSTEALPVTLIESEDILKLQEEAAVTGEIGTLVGKAINGVNLKIIKPLDREIESFTKVKELKNYEIGEVIVSGENVSPRYYDHEQGTVLAKIPDKNGFWHRMGDMGYLDNDNRLYFCGRKAHIVNDGGETLYSVPVEKIFNKHSKVSRSALVELNSGAAALVVEPLPQHWPETEVEKEKFRKELKALAITNKNTKGINKFFFHHSFPVDGRHNAKIFRDELGIWASKLTDYKSAA